MTTLKDRWNEVCEAYLSEFCKRHGFDREDADWVGNDIGGLAQIGDYFVNMSEIKYDVDNQVPEKTFFLWYDYSMEVHEIESKWHELENYTTLTHINYPSFCKGAPVPYSPEKLESWKESARKTEEAKRNFLEIVRNGRNTAFQATDK